MVGEGVSRISDLARELHSNSSPSNYANTIHKKNASLPFIAKHMEYFNSAKQKPTSPRGCSCAAADKETARSPNDSLSFCLHSRYSNWPSFEPIREEIL